MNRKQPRGSTPLLSAGRREFDGTDFFITVYGFRGRTARRSAGDASAKRETIGAVKTQSLALRARVFARCRRSRSTIRADRFRSELFKCVSVGCFFARCAAWRRVILSPSAPPRPRVGRRGFQRPPCSCASSLSQINPIRSALIISFAQLAASAPPAALTARITGFRHSQMSSLINPSSLHST